MSTIFSNFKKVAYLAPEVPSLSATFVYEEIHAIERQGIYVVPYSVHYPTVLATEQDDLANRTHYLYGGSLIIDIISGVYHLAQHVSSLKQGLNWLVCDMLEGRSLITAAKLARQFLAGAKMATQLKLQRCEHLHIHFAHVPTQIGMYAAAIANISFTVTAHANDIFERGFLLEKKASRSMKFLCISDFNRQFLLSLGLPEDKLAVVRCGVSFPSVIRHSTVIGGQIRIGTLARLVEKKGIDVLLRSLAILSNSPYLFHLSIVGDGPLLEELKEQAKILGLHNYVNFEGAMSHTQVTKWMSSLDIFVLACKVDKNGDMDGIPVVLMEAMSQSIPVISTRLSGIPELILHEKTGLLADPGNPDSLAIQINRMVTDHAMREILVAKARGHVIKEFGQPVNIERLIHFANLHRSPTTFPWNAPSIYN
jgi:glycosyltransferase involved in cell wall biosynthesis